MEEKTAVHIVWFKRDLRVADHAPLWQAAQRGPVLPLFIIEPSQLQAPDHAPRHYAFLRATLLALRADLAALGQPLAVRVGEAVSVLDSLRRQFEIAGLWAHEETTTLLGYARDRAVRDWARANRVPFTELPHNGVVRRLRSRDEWADLRMQRMRQPLLPAPAALPPLPIPPGRIPEAAQLGLAEDVCPTPAAGTAVAHDLLDAFFNGRCADYVRGMSSPLTAPDVCSRLSPHLSLGAMSARTVVQATQRRLRAQPDAHSRRLAGALDAFESRLAWRDHFMQKIEDEPEIEQENFVRAYDGMRGHDAALVAAWAAGETGFPMIDACMRALAATGWLNFRMRAMLVTFVAFDVWQHWREPALHLARLFVDYEPGIHYSQMQMQAGTTGNRTVRVYNPVKQGQQHDPQGAFVRRWLPELTAVPNSFIHAPWLLPPLMQQRLGVLIGRDYPAPLVTPEKAVQAARRRFALVHNSADVQFETEQVRARHGSRKRPSSTRRPPSPPPNQLRLL